MNMNMSTERWINRQADSHYIFTELITSNSYIKLLHLYKNLDKFCMNVEKKPKKTPKLILIISNTKLFLIATNTLKTFLLKQKNSEHV